MSAVQSADMVLIVWPFPASAASDEAMPKPSLPLSHTRRSAYLSSEGPLAGRSSRPGKAPEFGTQSAFKECEIALRGTAMKLALSRKSILLGGILAIGAVARIAAQTSSTRAERRHTDTFGSKDTCDARDRVATAMFDAWWYPHDTRL